MATSTSTATYVPPFKRGQTTASSPPPETPSASKPALAPVTGKGHDRTKSDSWRPSSTPQPTPASSSARFQVGELAYLPASNLIDHRSICFKSCKRKETYDHPCLVTEVHDNGDVGVMVITSLAGQSLWDRWAGHSLHDNAVFAHLLIATHQNTDGYYSHPDQKMPEMVLEYGQLAKVSYLRRDLTIRIEERSLSIHCRGEYGPASGLRMTQQSMEDLEWLQKYKPTNVTYA